MDPLYFIADVASETKRAAELLEWMVPEKGRVGCIAPGHLIVFRCDPRVLMVRLASRDKTYAVDQLTPHIEVIDETWKNHPITVIDTTNMSTSQVVSKVLEIILFEPYQPVDIQSFCASKAGISR